MMLIRKLIAVLLACGMAAQGAEDVSAQIEAIREKHKLPALAVAAMKDGKLLAIAATGLRRLGGEERVTVEDQWHLGSCTKSMTASVAAMLVERGKIEWSSTVGEVLAELRPSMDAAWRRVTLEQLLAHRAGAPGDAPADLWAEAGKRQGTPGEQRLAFVRGLLQRPPESVPGSKFVYSNQGYSIVGVMLETVTGEAWESLMGKMLFVPLGLKSAGFGAAGVAEKVDQPWGHRGLTPVPPGPLADNPAAIAPGGVVHMSIGDFARYAAWHASGERLLAARSFTKLHTPLAGQDYALGWRVLERPWAGGAALMHNGTNTMNYAVMWLSPKRHFAVVAACNVAGKEAEEACDEAVAALIQHALAEKKL